MIKINIDKQFDFFLEAAELNSDNMPCDELRERKIAFYSGITQMWKLFLEISELPEADVNAVFDDIDDQLKEFWQQKVQGL